MTPPLVPNPGCACTAGQWLHHHAFGGVFRCHGPKDCIQCQATPDRQANGRDTVETR